MQTFLSRIQVIHIVKDEDENVSTIACQLENLFLETDYISFI